MTDIDYTQFKIVGVVEAQPNTKHAIINAVGYLGSDWKFTPLSPTEAKQVFSFPRTSICSRISRQIQGTYR